MYENFDFESAFADLAKDWRAAADKSEATGDGSTQTMERAGVYDKLDSLMEAWWAAQESPRTRPCDPGIEITDTPAVNTTDMLSIQPRIIQQQSVVTFQSPQEVLGPLVINEKALNMSHYLRPGPIIKPGFGEGLGGPPSVTFVNDWMTEHKYDGDKVKQSGEILTTPGQMEEVAVEDTSVYENWSQVYPNGFGIAKAVNGLLCLAIDHMPAYPEWGSVRASVHEFGWIVFVYSAMEQNKLPAWLMPIWFAAVKYKCRMIEFDESAPIYDEFPTYAW